MAAPPPILCALLLLLAWSAGEPRWRLASLGLAAGCFALGLYVIATDPRAFVTDARKGSTSALWPRGLYP